MKFFSAICFRVSCEFYGPALISAMINTAMPELSWYLAFLSMSIACTVLLLAYTYPLYITKQIWDSKKKLSPEELKQAFPNLLSGLKADKTLHLCYYPFFFLKQFTLVSSLIALRGEYFQTSSFFFRVYMVSALYSCCNCLLFSSLRCFRPPFRRPKR